MVAFFKLGLGLLTVTKIADKVADREYEKKSRLSNVFFSAAAGVTAIASIAIAVGCVQGIKTIVLDTSDKETNVALAHIAKESSPEITPGTSVAQVWHYTLTPFIGHQVCNREKCRVFKCNKQGQNLSSLNNDS